MLVGIKFDIITHHFMLEFVDSGLYFVQDQNNFIYPLLQVGSGSDEKSLGSGSGQKSTDPDPHPCHKRSFSVPFTLDVPLISEDLLDSE